MEFYRLFKLLNEESVEDRKKREIEAERRRIALDSHRSERERIRSNNPYGSRSKVGSQEWYAYIDQLKSIGQSPINKFIDAVDSELVRIAKLDPVTHLSLGDTGFVVPGGLHNFMGEPKNAKEEADSFRVTELIFDSYDDGSSSTETARMVLDLLHSLGYTKQID